MAHTISSIKYYGYLPFEFSVDFPCEECAIENAHACAHQALQTYSFFLCLALGLEHAVPQGNHFFLVLAYVVEQFRLAAADIFERLVLSVVVVVVCHGRSLVNLKDCVVSYVLILHQKGGEEFHKRLLYQLLLE